MAKNNGKSKPTKEEPKTVQAPVMLRPSLDPALLRRAAKPKPKPEELEQQPRSVTAGPIDKVIDLAFNPTRDKIREVTVIDRMQGHLFPQADMCNMLMHYCLDIAFFREDSEHYAETHIHPRPIPPDGMDELLFRTAQWQKSVLGKNLDRALDVALAETENKTEGDAYAGGDPWGKE